VPVRSTQIGLTLKNPSKPSAAVLRRALLTPRSIALIGASDDASKTAGRPLSYLRRAGFKGNVYPVNPGRDTVQQEQAWPSISALPEVPDHAFILTGTDAAMKAAEECAAAGVPVVTLLATGFSEVGAEGAAREQRLREIIAQSDTRVLGPSSLGVVNVREKLVLTANAAFAEPDLSAGGIFVASHSGSLIGALVSRGKERGIGFAGLVSVGNEADLSIGEICSATLADPNITGYMLFLEAIRKGEALREFAREAARLGKPVIAYKLGRSAAAAELSVSHTGALAGEDDVAEAFLKDCGIARVETFEALLEGLPLLHRVPIRARGGRPPKVGVLTTTGGGAAMVVDQLGIRGIDVEQPSAETYRRLAAADVNVTPGRIVDLTMAGTRYEVMRSALNVLLTAPEFDLVLAVVGSSARFAPELAVKPIIESAAAPTPLAAFLAPDAAQALARLNQAGVPNFRTPEACADAISAAFRRRSPVADIVSRQYVPAARDGRMLDEYEAYAVLERLGIPHAPTTVVQAGAPVPTNLPIPFPVAVKILSSRIEHKTDVGGVALNVTDTMGLSQAIDRISDAVRKNRPDVPVERLLVQSMNKGVGEALIGYRLDPQVGPIVMLAAGGIFTEIYRDRSLRLAPVTLETAREMIGEVKAMQVLAGYRGLPAGDLEALATAIVAMSQLACLDDMTVAEAEVNPLIVRRAGEGVVAVDALLKLA
jgi:acyl-CoA synthetase (NDP forming)